jgi:molybdopterin-dependent oxidoreductase alpha subunit
MLVGSGGGFRAIKYTLKKGREAGGIWKMYKALRSKNACKTCALGMGGQKGGMVNEGGSFPEVCKKSLQAMAADMQPGIVATFWTDHSIQELKQWTPRQLETAGRLIQPVRYRQGANGYEPISWSDAFQTIVKKLQSISPDESFWYFSGRSSNEAGFLLQLLARMYGTNHVNNCSFYCHQASGVGLQSIVGSSTATVSLEDFEASDCVFLIGGNPASNHPRMMTTLMQLRRRGGKVIVINPVRETGLLKFRVPSDVRSLFFGTKIASHYYQPHIGGDLAVLWGVAKRIEELAALDLPFLQQRCHGSDAWMAALKHLSWSEIERCSGLTQREIFEIADLYAGSKSAVFAWTMGITHHVNGVENVQAIGNLALARGMVGRHGAGLMPIRGHSNIQGIGSVGVTPKLKQQIFDQLRDKFSVQLPSSSGYDTLACMDAAHEGRMRMALCLGGNLYGSNPDATYADQALAKLDLLVMLNTTLNTGHAHGLAKETIILPVLARDEEPEPTTQESMFNFVRLSDGGPRRHPGPRSEVQVIAELGRQLFPAGGPVDWAAMAKTQTIRHWIAEVVPGYAQVKDIDKTKQEFAVEGRLMHEAKFPTSSGLAHLHVHALPALRGIGPRELRLMTVRSEGQFNTVVYEEEDLYRNQERRDIILMHPDDLKRLGLKHNQPVTIRSAAGVMHGILARGWDQIRAGNALMYYPEANVLVDRSIDPASRTPSFKNVVVSIDPAN